MELGGALGIGPQKKTPLSSIAFGDTSFQRKKAKYCAAGAHHHPLNLLNPLNPLNPGP
jgi:hypothetical protein